jgi:lipocalin
LFTSDYRVIALDEKDYRYIMVTSNSKRFLWILSRTPKLDTETYEKLVSMAERNGFDVQKLQKVEQNWENTQVFFLDSKNERRSDG